MTRRTLTRALAAALAAGAVALTATSTTDPAPVQTRYEDGSYRLADGTTGCTPGMPCDTDRNVTP